MFWFIYSGARSGHVPAVLPLKLSNSSDSLGTIIIIFNINLIVIRAPWLTLCYGLRVVIDNRIRGDRYRGMLCDLTLPYSSGFIGLGQVGPVEKQNQAASSMQQIR